MFADTVRLRPASPQLVQRALAGLLAPVQPGPPATAPLDPPTDKEHPVELRPGPHLRATQWTYTEGPTRPRRPEFYHDDALLELLPSC